MKLINEKSLRELQLTPVDEIVSAHSFLEGEKDVAFVCCINPVRTEGKGYLLGIAKRGELGYTPTNYVLNEHNYNIANKWVEEANAKLFQRSAKETYMIVLSTMSGITA